MQTSSKIDTDPYGKPAIVFTHEDRVDGIAKDLRQMLKEDFAQHLDLQHYKNYAQENPVQIVQQTEAVKSTIENKPGPPKQPATYSATLFDMDDPAIKKEPTPEAKPQFVTKEPLIILYDLFGFTQEERSQVNKPKKRGRKSKSQSNKAKELPFMDWREEMIVNAHEKREKLQQETAEAYPIFDARREEQPDRLKEEAEREQQERMKPVPFLLEDIPSHYRDGSLVTDSTNRIGYLHDLNGFQPMFHPLQITGTQQAKASLYIEIGDTYHHLYNNEATRLEANPALREMLNRLYDDFTRHFGNINDAKNLSLIKMDAGGTEILSL